MIVYNTCWVKYKGENPKSYCCQNLVYDQEYQIQDIERNRWALDADVFTDIGSGILLVGNGTSYFNVSLDGWNWLIQNAEQNIVLSNVDKTSNAQKALLVSPTVQEGSSTILVSHDFCDKTTWYTDSVRVSTAETLTTSDYLIYSSLNTHWIDLSHGKVPYEHRISATYAPIIYVDDVVTTTGFTINYAAGTITFDSSQEGKVISAKYSYATTSIWKIKPETGKILKLIGTIVKFADDCTIGENQYINFQLYVGGYAYGSPTIYKNIADFIKCATGNPNTVKGFGEIEHDIMWIPFSYVTSKDLKSSQLAEIRIKISDDIPMTGEWGVVCAECISLAE
jgi:hypothetical protein